MAAEGQLDPIVLGLYHDGADLGLQRDGEEESEAVRRLIF
jgi:hypothetical protein